MPADQLTDPAPANTFAHLDATIVLERSIAGLGIYPAVDPLASTSRALAPEIVGKEHYAWPVACRGCCSATKTCRTSSHSRDGRAIGRGQDHGLPRAQDSALPEPAVHRGGSVHGLARRLLVSIKDTSAAFKEILDGKHDEVGESDFYMKGAIEEIKQS